MYDVQSVCYKIELILNKTGSCVPHRLTDMKWGCSSDFHLLVNKFTTK